jgi:cytochrome c oxidase accessory protein FixG
VDDFRATLCTADSRGRRKWVYPIIVAGAFRFRRKIVATGLLAFYLLMPWLVIGGEQAVRLDVVHRRFTVLGSSFQASETLYLFLLLGTAVFSLFLFTALLGRVWCGWGCPQTVFLEFVFRPIETLIEGNAAARRRLDQAPWGAAKIARKGLKYGIFAILSWGLSSTFLAYFVGRHELLAMMTQPPTEHLGLFVATLSLMGVLMFQFGWFREQFCSVLCPYARFQSVLLDSSSLAITYDTRRGEPRGKEKGFGDCIDCALCVRACPTGIDIRNGLQLECVQCASCIDACNQVMHKIGRAPGLIRYSSESAIGGKPYRILRPRILVYCVIVAAYATAFSYLLAERPSAEFEVIRVAADVPFVVQDDGMVMNHFKIHFVNRSKTAASFTASIVGTPEAKAVVPVTPFTVAADSEQELPIFIRFPKSVLHGGKASVRLEVKNNDAVLGTQSVPLIGPDI